MSSSLIRTCASCSRTLNLSIAPFVSMSRRSGRQQTLSGRRAKAARGCIQMTLQKIKSLDGKDEYVLLPIAVFRAMRGQIEQRLTGRSGARSRNDDYVPFVLEDYVDNPVALARINAKITQTELARRMEVSQAYVSKIEAQAQVSGKLLAKVNMALSRMKGAARATPRSVRRDSRSTRVRSATAPNRAVRP